MKLELNSEMARALPTRRTTSWAAAGAMLSREGPTASRGTSRTPLSRSLSRTDLPRAEITMSKFFSLTLPSVCKTVIRGFDSRRRLSAFSGVFPVLAGSLRRFVRPPASARDRVEPPVSAAHCRAFVAHERP